MTQLLKKSEYKTLRGLWTLQDILKYVTNIESEAMTEELERKCPQYVSKGKIKWSVGGWNFIRSILP